MKKLSLVLLSLMLLFAAACAQTDTQQEAATATPQQVQGPQQQTGYAAGAYTAETTGLNGKIVVETTFSEDAIVSVEVLENIETAGVGATALETMADRVVAEQSLAVDTVTGATISSAALLNAVEDCAKQAGGDVDALRAAKEDANKLPQSYEYTADVVIVGGGGAGLAAACAATELGASVIIVEKVDYLGGNTMVSGGIYNSADPENQAEIEMTDALRQTVADALAEEPVSEAHKALMEQVGADYEAYLNSGSTGLFDSTAWHALQTWNGGDKVADLELVKAFCEQAPAGLEWLKSMGLTVTKIGQGGGALWQRTHYTEGPLGTSIINTYTNALSDRMDLADIYYSTTAKELLTDDSGKVVGVAAEDKVGNTYTFYCNNAVILATGGFAANVALRQEYCQGEKWPDLGPNVKSTNLPGITGDGIFMAQAVGANLVDMDQIQLLHTCSPRTGTTWANYYTSASLIFVNKEGKRFVREDGRRDDMSKAVIAQTDSMMWLVQSGDFIPDPAQAKTSDGVPLLDSVERGDWYMADTLEELAEEIGVPAEALVQTVEEYNAACESGVDAFGRALLTMPFTKGPYYAYARTPSCHHTMGGVEINASTQVISTEGTVIPGLYAAGEVTGGIHGGNRLGGNAIADTVVFGRIAGTMAAQ